MVSKLGQVGFLIYCQVILSQVGFLKFSQVNFVAITVARSMHHIITYWFASGMTVLVFIRPIELRLDNQIEKCTKR